MLRDSVRRWVGDRVLPDIAEWFEEAELPSRELAKELGDLGLLGMHLEGYGCAGASSTAYGVACRELEYGDSGHPLARLRAGLAGDVPDLEVRLGGAEGGVAAADGGGRRDRLLRADRARLRLGPGEHAHDAPSATATTGSSTARRCGSPTAASPTSRSCGPRPRRRRARLRRPDRHQGLHGERHPPQAVAAGVRDVRALARGRPAARPTRCCPRSRACAGRCRA